jgi:hypothetical protein
VAPQSTQPRPVALRVRRTYKQPRREIASATTTDSLTMISKGMWLRSAAAASSGSSTPQARHICWAPGLSQTNQSAERFYRRDTSLPAAADPCFFHPASPLARALVSRLQKRCSFKLPESDDHTASTSSRLNDPLYMHPGPRGGGSIATCTDSGRTDSKSVVFRLDLSDVNRNHTDDSTGSLPRQPTPRPTDAQAAWAAAFTEKALVVDREHDTSSRMGEGRPSVLSPLPLDAFTNHRNGTGPVSMSKRFARSSVVHSSRGAAL